VKSKQIQQKEAAIPPTAEAVGFFAEILMTRKRKAARKRAAANAAAKEADRNSENAANSKAAAERTEEPDKKGAPAESESQTEVRGPGNVLVAVDLANLYCQVKELHGEQAISADYSTLQHQLAVPGDNCQLLCFAPIPNPIEDPKGYTKTGNLHNLMRYLGYVVYTTERRNGKADVDVALAVKVMEVCTAKKPDYFILVSADGDFSPLMLSLREHGVITQVAAVGSSLSARLQMSADSAIDLQEWAEITIDHEGKKKEPKQRGGKGMTFLTPTTKQLYVLEKTFGDMARRKLNMHGLSSALSESLRLVGKQEHDVHRGILRTLKECVSVIEPHDMTKDDLAYLKEVVELLKNPTPSLGLNADIRYRFLNVSG